ncbi:GNAT family N-acetyltransferase [Brevibacterium linens]|uniref:Ribosomal-protein-alanine N-acetyltransferase n=2 Tax=Brevibacterium linens TaxID=1703 RepID=A0A2H1IE10_BRELN|nr:GNAT family N-acetyltransferase [Brevibacterium linens]AZU01477.1 GNAT family N-acetyltransferase [Brevibacterium linens]KAB1948496.1 GNAT family N-acetyltransferase [Brevibacterium linens ATCC 9172]SMX73433.1 ribosomal-protein-alanine N-acetyltransferase [Brevibacterium linens]SMX74368.1 ribosomal-protein-alanine N-acetyltransferase [Brevibacterium linens ATCC 9172]
MTSTTIAELPWWDLAEVADHDAAIFGPTAWTLGYYWSVKAQNGTIMLAARAASADDSDADSTASGEDATASAGELAGWIVMSGAGAEADVMTIATTEAARGQGIGRALLRAGIDWAKDRGAEVVHLEVDERNTAALEMYAAFGFEEWGRRPDYYPGAAGILMRLRIRT